MPSIHRLKVVVCLHAALERAIYHWYYVAVNKKAEMGLCVEQSRKLFSDIRGRGGASNACFHS